MEVPHKRLNISPEGLNDSAIGICITMSKELKFLRLIRLSLGRLSASLGGLSVKRDFFKI